MSMRVHLQIEDFGTACGRKAKLTSTDIEEVTCEACFNRLARPVERQEVYAFSESGYSAPPHHFFTKVAGVTHANDDGSSRQVIIRECRAGESLDLVREPENRYDSGAIKVMRRNGQQLGYIPQHVSRGGDSGLSRDMDRNGAYCCRISDITGGGDQPHGVNIEVRNAEFDAEIPKHEFKKRVVIPLRTDDIVPPIPERSTVWLWVIFAVAILFGALFIAAGDK
jgi:hypothetical protein